MTKFAVSLFLLPLISPASAQAPQAGADSSLWDARVTDVRGQVTVFEKEGDPEGYPAEKGLPLEEGDKVATGPDSSAEIAVEGASVIVLRSNSQFTLESARKSDAIFGLSVGTFLSKFKKLLTSQNLSVRTPTAVAAVRGTEFAVEVAPDKPDETRVGVFDEGKVEVRALTGGTELLSASQETSVRKGQAPLPASQLKTFAAYRRQVRALPKRLKTLAKEWKPLLAQERSALRKDLKAKAVKKRDELREKRRKAEEKKKESQQRRSEQQKSRHEKMERRREQIRRRR